MSRVLFLFLICFGWQLGCGISVGQSTLPTAATAVPNLNSLPLTTSLPANIPVGLAGLTNGYVPDNTYQLRVGDTVSFQIVEDRILNLQLVPTSLVVMDSGEVDVPYIGRVKSVGKTCDQLGEEIKKELEKNYYKKATVVLSLNIANHLLGRIYIWGQVHNQGPVNLVVNEQLTIAKAIMQAGGFADFANKRKVKVVRATPQGTNQTFDLDMTQIMDNGDLEKDMVLKPNDIIIVPSRLINF